MITPTSAKSKQYEALGIDEIAEDIETVFAAVSELQDNPAGGGTTTIVNITSTGTTYDDGRPAVESGILSMGSSPIELLPAAGVGKYYEIESIIFEYNYITSNYTTTSDYLTIKYGSYEFGFVSSFIKTSSFDSFAIISMTPSLSIDPVFVPATAFFPLNSGVTIETFNGDDPTDGDGTIRAIITYTLRTFGA